MRLFTSNLKLLELAFKNFHLPPYIKNEKILSLINIVIGLFACFHSSVIFLYCAAKVNQLTVS